MLFCRFRCRRRRRCLSSLLLWSRNFATMVTWRHTSLKFSACESAHLSEHSLNITKLMRGRSKGNRRKLRLDEDLCYQLAWSFPFFKSLGSVLGRWTWVSHNLASLGNINEIKVSFTRIGNFFFPDSKISTFTRIRIKIEFARPHVSDTYADLL